MMFLSLCPHVMSQAPQHLALLRRNLSLPGGRRCDVFGFVSTRNVSSSSTFRSSETQADCDGCDARQSTCSPSNVGNMSKRSHPILLVILSLLFDLRAFVFEHVENVFILMADEIW